MQSLAVLVLHMNSFELSTQVRKELVPSIVARLWLKTTFFLIFKFKSRAWMAFACGPFVPSAAVSEIEPAAGVPAKTRSARALKPVHLNVDSDAIERARAAKRGRCQLEDTSTQLWGSDGDSKKTAMVCNCFVLLISKLCNKSVTVVHDYSLSDPMDIDLFCNEAIDLSAEATRILDDVTEAFEGALDTAANIETCGTRLCVVITMKRST